MQRCLDIGNLQITPRVNRIEKYESFDITLAVQLGSVIVKYLKDTGIYPRARSFSTTSTAALSLGVLQWLLIVPFKLVDG
jgi:hypothetical protein